MKQTHRKQILIQGKNTRHKNITTHPVLIEFWWSVIIKKQVITTESRIFYKENLKYLVICLKKKN